MARLILWVGLLAACLPVVAVAQTQQPLIGILNARSSTDAAVDLDALRTGLRELGFEEGRNVFFVPHFAAGRYDRLRGFAQDLVRKNVAVIIAGGGATAIRAAKDATRSIPIVFTSGNDPPRVPTG